MAANLLSSLYHEIIQADQMQRGFKSLLNSVDDLKLDVPSAEDDLGLFLARAVVDDILPPSFLHKVSCGKQICVLWNCIELLFAFTLNVATVATGYIRNRRQQLSANNILLESCWAVFDHSCCGEACYIFHKVYCGKSACLAPRGFLSDTSLHLACESIADGWTANDC